MNLPRILNGLCFTIFSCCCYPCCLCTFSFQEPAASEMTNLGLPCLLIMSVAVKAGIIAVAFYFLTHFLLPLNFCTLWGASLFSNNHLRLTLLCGGPQTLYAGFDYPYCWSVLFYHTSSVDDVSDCSGCDYPYCYTEKIISLKKLEKTMSTSNTQLNQVYSK